MNTQADVTYVHEQIEVKLTGRTAEQTLRSGKVDILHEFSPVDTNVGSWKKWARINQLFTVTK